MQLRPVMKNRHLTKFVINVIISKAVMICIIMTSGLADIWTLRRFLPYRRVTLQIELNAHIPSWKERHVYIQPVLIFKFKKTSKHLLGNFLL